MRLLHIQWQLCFFFFFFWSHSVILGVECSQSCILVAYYILLLSMMKITFSDMQQWTIIKAPVSLDQKELNWMFIVSVQYCRAVAEIVYKYWNAFVSIGIWPNTGCANKYYLNIYYNCKSSHVLQCFQKDTHEITQLMPKWSKTWLQ